MKKSLLVLCVIGAFPFAASAQSTATPLSNVTAKNEIIIFGVADMAVIAIPRDDCWFGLPHNRSF